HQLHIFHADAWTGSAATFWPKGMPVYAFELHLYAIHIDAVAWPDFHRAEPNPLGHAMLGLAVAAQRQFGGVQRGRFGAPGANPLKLRRTPKAIAPGPQGHRPADGLAVAVKQLYGKGIRPTVHRRLHSELTVVLGVDSQRFNVGLGQYLQPYRPENPAEDPIVGLTFGVVHATVGRMLGYRHFEHIFATIYQQITDIVAEGVKGALVCGAGRLTVNRYLGVGHHAFEDNVDPLSFPRGRHLKPPLVPPFFFATGIVGRMTVMVRSKPLQLPARRYTDLRPFPRIHAPRAKEVPLHHVIAALAR